MARVLEFEVCLRMLTMFVGQRTAKPLSFVFFAFSISCNLISPFKLHGATLPVLFNGLGYRVRLVYKF